MALPAIKNSNLGLFVANSTVFCMKIRPKQHFLVTFLPYLYMLYNQVLWMTMSHTSYHTALLFVKFNTNSSASTLVDDLIKSTKYCF